MKINAELCKSIPLVINSISPSTELSTVIPSHFVP